MAAGSCPGWRMLNASMIWEKPRNNAKNRRDQRLGVSFMGADGTAA
jgi:hypothetical protein